jgi:hypothetical protein
MRYFYTKNSSDELVIVEVAENHLASCIADENNPTYQAYLAWVAEGNTATEWSPEA